MCRGAAGRAASRRAPGRDATRNVGFGWCCGVLAFEVVAALAADSGGLVTRRPELLLVGAGAVTVLGAHLGRRGGSPTSTRAWARFALGASSGSALAELADLHLLVLHRAPVLSADVALHGLAVVPALLAGRLLMQLGGQRARLPVRPGLDTTSVTRNS